MLLAHLKTSLAYIFEMVPTNVRIVSDDDGFSDADIIIAELNPTDSDRLLHQMLLAITNVVKKPKEIIIIDLVPTESGYTFKFVAIQ